jgi:hypothetical protein
VYTDCDCKNKTKWPILAADHLCSVGSPLVSLLVCCATPSAETQRIEMR